MKKVILVNPQWQGGGEKTTYYGAKELERLYLGDKRVLEVPVGLDEDLKKKNGIIGYDEINGQMKAAYEMLKAEGGDFVFAVGGGCDADVPVIAYLNELYEGELFVLWLDAHGDINSPEESRTGLFYGMPLRILMGESGLFGDIIKRPLKPKQFIHIGGRDFDKAEKEYIDKNNICKFITVSVEELKGILDRKRHIYVHLDLDVLDPNEFRNTPLPVEGGVSKEWVLELLGTLENEYDLAGIGVYEYAPCGEVNEFVRTVVDTALICK